MTGETEWCIIPLGKGRNAMILAIDIGNIRTTIALFTQDGALSFK